MAGYPRVTHPSATNFTFARLHVKSVRLACVKHAASVHPEPGSNSHVKSCPNQKFIWLTVFGLFSIFESSFRSAALMLFTLKNFQGCIVVYLSRFKPMLSHRFCCSFCDSFVRLPQVFQLVNNFFKVFLFFYLLVAFFSQRT